MQLFDVSTVFPRGSDPFYILTCFIKLVTTSWTHSISLGWNSICSLAFVLSGYCMSKMTCQTFMVDIRLRICNKTLWTNVQSPVRKPIFQLKSKIEHFLQFYLANILLG